MLRPLQRSLLLLLGITVPALIAAPLDTKKEELQQVQGRISDLQTALKSARNQQSELNKKLQAVEQKIGDQARRLRVLGDSLNRQKQQLQQLQQRRSAQEQELDAHRSLLSQQIRTAYAMGRQERIKIMLNQQDPATISRVMAYYDYFNRARAEQLQLIEELISGLQETEADLISETRRLEDLQTKELQQQTELKQTQLARYEVIKALSAEISSKGQELGGLKKSETQLKSLMQRLQQELSTLPTEATQSKPFRALKGRLPWPSKGRLAARFGMAKGGGLRWDGVLIAGEEGQEVQAVHQGRIAFADWLRGFGLLLIIDHGSGYMSLYGHNQSLFKEVGDWVQPGEVIALVGNSGGRLEMGVYFSIRKKGRPVNPKKWCKKIKGNRITGVEQITWAKS
ncbi:MAG: peptidoglycan DD-metalloendopeptidase family protein [Candidatus Polarisedimenticolaceae bacterium]|nr:peptidoglycan DD-metalloendopeptidase family protein [Candidatus Polarisedimenticolaceae bacterium]